LYIADPLLNSLQHDTVGVTQSCAPDCSRVRKSENYVPAYAVYPADPAMQPDPPTVRALCPAATLAVRMDAPAMRLASKPGLPDRKRRRHTLDYLAFAQPPSSRFPPPLMGTLRSSAPNQQHFHKLLCTLTPRAEKPSPNPKNDEAGMAGVASAYCIAFSSSVCAAATGASYWSSSAPRRAKYPRLSSGACNQVHPHVRRPARRLPGACAQVRGLGFHHASDPLERGVRRLLGDHLVIAAKLCRVLGSFGVRASLLRVLPLHVVVHVSLDFARAVELLRRHRQ
jgi:hypothetical protein